jgi:hypothetical protein
MERDGLLASSALSEMLSITYKMAEELFAEWPSLDLDRDAWEQPRTLEAAKDGAAYIDKFIAKYGPQVVAA